MKETLKRLGKIETGEMPGKSAFVKPYTISYDMVELSEPLARLSCVYTPNAHLLVESALVWKLLSTENCRLASAT